MRTRLVGGPDMQRVGVRVAVDGDRLDAQLPTGADDADGDLAPIGDEQPSERRLGRARRSPRSAGAAARSRVSLRKDSRRCGLGGIDTATGGHSGMLPCLRDGLRSPLALAASGTRR